MSTARRRFAGVPTYLTILAVVLVVAALTLYAIKSTSLDTGRPVVRSAQFLGSAACAQCHQAEHDAWKGSHHELAMQAATASSVLAPFNGEQFTEDGITSVFSQRNGRYYVTTEGKNGKMQEFEITWTFGLAPLQQYLIPMPDGAVQALTIAWDARSRQQGGQRWFDLQAGGHIHAGNELHWTGRQNNWNFMCAECHMTQFKKNYDAKNRSYNSSWSAINVGCEACHGPGSGHVAWAALPDVQRQQDGSKGLALLLDERKHNSWTIQPESGNAKPDRAVSQTEQQLCARCHSRRSQISDDYHAGKSLLDTHIPSLIGNGLFWEDGQMKEEVYNTASFEQSKMHAKGVTCSDCHDPHSQQLRRPGNQVCFQCHSAHKYEATSHHFHKAGSAGASCAACHMPVTTYMTVDARHDHSIRVPRPDLSLTAGTPNACNKCHTDKTVQWAASAALRWYPQLSKRPKPLVLAMMPGTTGEGDTLALLGGVMRDTNQSSILRATAMSRIPAAIGSEQISLQLRDHDPLLRMTAIETLAGMPGPSRSVWFRPLLTDPVRAVRIAAARALADLPDTDWSEQDKSAFNAALKEYVDVQYFNADRPESYNNLGNLYADQHDWVHAEQALQVAVEMDSATAVSQLNLADIYRAQGKEDNARTLLQQTIQLHPESALAQHALGLSLIRARQTEKALSHLRKATQLEPENAHFAYVYILALESSHPVQALTAWRLAVKQHPGDPELMSVCRGLNCSQVDQN